MLKGCNQPQGRALGRLGLRIFIAGRRPANYGASHTSPLQDLTPMTFLADALSRVKPSATIAVTQKARDLKAQGREVISLSVGEPDFDTPEHICARRPRRRSIAARRAIRRCSAFRRCARRWPKSSSARTGSTTRPPTRSSRPAASTFCSTPFSRRINPGDEVIVPRALLGELSRDGRDLRRNDRLRRHDDGGRLQAAAGGARARHHAQDQVAGAELARPTLRAPPTAIDEMKKVTDVLLRHPQVHVLTDDIYEHLVYGDFKFVTPAQVEPDSDRAHADDERRLQGLRHDRLAHRLRGRARAPLIKAMDLLQGQQTSGACSIAQWAAVEALDGPQDHLATFPQGLSGAARSRRLHAQPGEISEMPDAGRRLLRLSVLRRGDRPQDARRQGHRDATRISSPRCWRRKASPWCKARRSAPGRISACPTPRPPRVLEDACAKIQAFCASLT